MKITAIRCFRISGTADYGATEERKVDMLDAYPEFGSRNPVDRTPRGKISAIYVEVEAGSAAGLFGPIFEEAAWLVRTKVAPILAGRDALAYEFIWDALYRHAHSFGSGGGKGYHMMAISAADCALWDLRGKLLGQPVCRLLGGPTRPYVSCYASMLGHSLDPGLVRERAQQAVARGYAAQKWFFRYGPAHGMEGLQRNVALVRTVREAVGPDVDIMFDCSMAWDAIYTSRVLERIAEFRPYWLEEPFPPDRLDDFASIRRSTRIPIATGEHEYTRWGFQQLLDGAAADILQPDPEWCGGITETVKICTLASAHRRLVFPHGHSTLAALNVIASQPPATCPMLEFLCNYQRLAQHFHRRCVEPEGGALPAPDTPGLGIEIDDAKVEQRVEL
jgi:L-alanine-DL-glutamate epimerase-like enolase superfamily enzyme